MRVKRSTVLNFFFLLLFKLILDLSYILVIHKDYPELSFSLSLNYIKLIESYFLLTLIFFIIPKTENKPSEFVIRFLFLLTVVPILSIYALKNESRSFLYIFIIGFVITISILNIFPTIKFTKPKNSNFVLFISVILASILTCGLIIKNNGIPSLAAFNLNLVYKIRENFQNSLFTSYLIPWQGLVINPFLIGMFYNNKKYFKLFATIIFELVLYLYTANKVFLFVPFIVIWVVYLVKKGKRLNDEILKGLIIGCIICLVFVLLHLSYWPMSLLTVRILFLPAEIQFNYYEFFSKHPFMYFAEGQLGRLFSTVSPYDKPAVNIIGGLYLGNPLTNANTGYLADAYMNLGILGVILFSILFALILKVIDSSTKKTSYAIALSILAVQTFVLTNCALLTTLLTEGLLLAILIIWFFNNQKNNNKLI